MTCARRPAAICLEALWQEGCAVRAYDPAAMTEARRIYGERPDFELCAQADGRADRRRRLGDRHRMEPVPQSRISTPSASGSSKR
jgi:hypothetical protein